MIVAVLALAMVALVMGAMAIGVILSGKTLKGSCGGVGSGNCPCDAAGVPMEQRACQARGLLRDQAETATRG
jgi:hypothetical protein